MIGVAADIVGTDDDRAGRTDIWDFVIDSVEDRWLLGFGWFSFWDDPANRAELFERTGEQFDSAHSSFMDTLLFLGGVGVVLLLAVVVFGLGRTWWEALGGTSWAMAWWAAVGMFAFIENVAESRIAFHSIFWLLLVAPGLRGDPLRRGLAQFGSQRGTARTTALRVVHLPVARVLATRLRRLDGSVNTRDRAATRGRRSARRRQPPSPGSSSPSSLSFAVILIRIAVPVGLA